jgi:predicted transposase
MKLTVQLQLLPERDHARRLRETVERFNEAANWLAGIAFERQTANKLELQHACYGVLRERFGLSAQMAVRCIAQVGEAYRWDKSIRPIFRKTAAMPFDQRMMSFKGLDRVSLLTLGGRVLVPFVLGKYQAEQFTHAKGQADLVLREDGKWFLLVTVDVPSGSPLPTADFIGVDLGIANIATDSDGEQHSGEDVERIRRKHNLQRKRLQRKGTKGAKKKLGDWLGRRPGSVATRIIGSARRSSRRPKAPVVGSLLRISRASASGLRLGAPTRAIGCRDGRSDNSTISSRTRRDGPGSPP